MSYLQKIITLVISMLFGLEQESWLGSLSASLFTFLRCFPAVDIQA